ncbi:MAG: hypothetical protein ACOYOK_03965 [Pseudobdellovibrionaceae bacterium]
MKNFIFAILILSTVHGTAAQKSSSTSAAPVATENRKTLLGGQSSTRGTALKANLKGLSLYASYDMADSLDFEASVNGKNSAGNFNSDKALGFGAMYDVADFSNGLLLQIGGSYEMGRTLSGGKDKNGPIVLQGAKPEIQFWTLFGQADVLLTEKFSLFGGGNYTFPQVKNVPGGTWKSKLGYQFGASFHVNRNFSIDGMMRTLNMSGSSDDQGVNTNYDNIRAQGFTVRGRYSFL